MSALAAATAIAWLFALLAALDSDPLGVFLFGAVGLLGLALRPSDAHADARARNPITRPDRRS